MRLLAVALMLVLIGCGSLPQHIGQVDPDLSVDTDESAEGLALDETSEIFCASGDRQYYFIGTSKPQLSLEFTDTTYSVFRSKYEAVRVKPVERSFRIHFNYKDRFAKFDVKKFKFEPKEKYYVYYSTYASRIKIWIEKSSGEVVYGQKPKDGSY